MRRCSHCSDPTTAWLHAEAWMSEAAWAPCLALSMQGVGMLHMAPPPTARSPPPMLMLAHSIQAHASMAAAAPPAARTLGALPPFVRQRDPAHTPACQSPRSPAHPSLPLQPPGSHPLPAPKPMPTQVFSQVQMYTGRGRARGGGGHCCRTAPPSLGLGPRQRMPLCHAHARLLLPAGRATGRRGTARGHHTAWKRRLEAAPNTAGAHHHCALMLHQGGARRGQRAPTHRKPCALLE